MKLMTDDGWQLNSDKTEEEEESEIVEKVAATLAQNVSSVNFVTSLLAPKLLGLW